MQTVMIFLFGIVVAFLVAVASVVPRRSALSLYELERRRDEGNTSADSELRREVLIDDVLSLKRVLEALLLVLSVLCAVVAFDYIVGTIVGVLVALLYGRIAHIDIVRAGVERMYEKVDEPIFRFVERHQSLCRIVRNVQVSQTAATVSSREELEHLVEESGTILTNDEKKLLKNGLHFNEKTVEQVMTPRSVIETVKHDDMVGPLMLNDLHKTGHSRFPVIKEDIDHVVGVLHIKELLTLRDKDTQLAEQAMDKRVFYINQDQTLERALAAFLKTRHHLFIVVNGYRETAGILTLEDVMEALLGREIVDEYDVHDDLRVVAARNAKDNNNAVHGTDVR